MLLPSFCCRLLLLAALIPVCAEALVIRNYSSSRHDRFVTADSVTTLNPNAYYGSSRYTGVGFGTNPGDVRQFALVTPEHVLFAKHYAFGGNIRFINTDGTVLNRSIGALTEVPNSSGGVSDLIIMKLSAPITEADKITPLPYLNLANETAYLNKSLTTFGREYRAGSGTIALFGNANEGTAQETRTFTFLYNKVRPLQSDDDAYAVAGDSGSPSFVTVNGKPALVGVHFAATEGVNTVDTFVPHYAETVNGLLAADGYQLIPANPVTVNLTAELGSATLRQAEASSITIDLSNTSANTATNPRLNLLFPSGAIPSSISAPGWIVENPSSGEYQLRRATLAGNTSVTVTASYTSVPVVTEISISATHYSDGSPEFSQTFDLPVQPTFGGFVSALSLKGELDDPDLDGIGNLLEYAFGGDPAVNSATATGGYALAPVSSLENGNISFVYARRTDAMARGLDYAIEFSETLEQNSWSTTLPSGFSLSTDPASPGFETATATFPAVSPGKNFVRVKVTLTE